MSSVNAKVVHRMTELETIRINDFYRDLIQRQLFVIHEDKTCEYMEDWNDRKVLEELGDGYVMSNISGFRSRLYGKFHKAKKEKSATSSTKGRVSVLEERAKVFNSNFETQAEINESSLRRIRHLEKIVAALVSSSRSHDATLGKLALLSAGAHTKEDAEVPSLQTDGRGSLIDAN